MFDISTLLLTNVFFVVLCLRQPENLNSPGSILSRVFLSSSVSSSFEDDKAKVKCFLDFLNKSRFAELHLIQNLAYDEFLRQTERLVDESRCLKSPFSFLDFCFLLRLCSDREPRSLRCVVFYIALKLLDASLVRQGGRLRNSSMTKQLLFR